MSSHNPPKRRLALKLLGGSALTGALADKLPAAWQRPIVNNSLLPAHAQTSVADDSPGISGGLRRLSVGGSQYTLYGDIATTGIPTTGIPTTAAIGQAPPQAAKSAAPVRPFITTWAVTAEDLSITIPAVPVGKQTPSYTVDWGDGSPPQTATGWISHTYPAAGTYSVRITGRLCRFDFYKAIDTYAENIDRLDASRPKLRSIESWGDVIWLSLEDTFYGCENLENNATDAPDLSRVTSLFFTFYGTKKFNGDLSNWDVSTITDMHGTFFEATAFNGNISNWNTSRVTEMFGMFYGATAFNQDISGWDTGQVKDMSSMFTLATAFNQDIGGWNVGSATKLGSMFWGATAFDQNLGRWDVSNVARPYLNMRNMFFGVTLSTHNYDALLQGWSKHSVPPDVPFSAGLSRYSPASIPARLALTSAGWQIEDGGLHLPSGVFTTTWRVEEGDLSITIPAFDAGGQTRDYTVDWGDGEVTESETGQAEHTYAEARDYTIRITGTLPWIKFGPDNADRNKLLTLEQWGDIQWRSLSQAFDSCENLRNNAVDAPELSDVTNMSRMFHNAENFDGDLSEWDVGNVTDMSAMFQGAAAFNGSIGGWNVGNVLSMNSIFRDAALFDQNLGEWDVSNVSDMRDMFKDVALSPDNYDALLSGWCDLDVQSEVMFNAGSSVTTDTSSDAYIIARWTLIYKGWTIEDGHGTITPATADRFLSGAFVTTWRVRVGDLSITIPAYDSDSGQIIRNYTVFWGDGAVSKDETGQATHTYAAAGTYYVQIIGDLPSITFYDDNPYRVSEDRDKIRSVEQWGNIQWENMESAFRRCGNLQINASDAPDLSRVTQMNGMFRSSGITNPDLSGWDVSNIQNMGYLFAGASHFNGNIRNWNVQNVTNMRYMFSKARSFNQNIGGWNTQNVIDMQSVFDRASSFDQDISGWDVRNATSMRFMLNLTNLSTANYDALLLGWSQSAVQEDVDFGARGVFTTGTDSLAYAARQILANMGWTIHDGHGILHPPAE